MLCFHDMSFCSSDCRNKDCRRFFSPKLREEAKRWWGSDDAPVAFSDFSGGCDKYQPGGQPPVPNLVEPK